MRQVLVAHESDHAVEFLVGRRPDLFGHVGDAVGIVPRVADREGSLCERLPAAHQRRVGRCAAHSFEIGAAGDRQRRFFVQEVDRRRSRHDIAALVAALQIEQNVEIPVVARAAQVEELAVAFGTALFADELPFGVDHARFVGRRGLFDHLVVADIRFADDHRNALFDDPRLLRGDLLERVAQQGRVFQPDVGDDAQDRHDDVRGVEPSPEPRLDHGHLDIALREVIEGHRGGHFEERQLRFDHLVVVLVHEVHHLLLGDHFAVNADAFAEVLQVGRGEEPCAVSRLLEHRGDDVGYGAFAVGAGHVDREEVPLGVAQVAAECGDTLQSRFVGHCAAGFERGQRLKEEFEGLGVVHDIGGLLDEMVFAFDPVGDVVEQTQQQHIFRDAGRIVAVAGVESQF